jgi:hypothetical protein
MEPESREPQGLEANEGSIYKRQCMLRDEMLALPVPADPSTPDRPLAESCNLCAEGMASEPTPEGVRKVSEIIEKHRSGNPDRTRLQILEAMYQNYQSAMGDPLSFRAVGEVQVGTPEQIKKRMGAMSHRLAAVGSFLEALYLAGVNRDADFVQKCTASLEGSYSMRTLEFQASLLLAYFSNYRTKSIALAYLTKWFPDCNLKADYAVLEAYMAACSTHGSLDSMKGLPYLADSGPALAALKKCGARTIRDLVELENQRRAEQERIQSIRAAAGECVLCGKPLVGFRKLFGARKHSGCSKFVDADAR